MQTDVIQQISACGTKLCRQSLMTEATRLNAYGAEGLYRHMITRDRIALPGVPDSLARDPPTSVKQKRAVDDDAYFPSGHIGKADVRRRLMSRALICPAQNAGRRIVHIHRRNASLL